MNVVAQPASLAGVAHGAMFVMLATAALATASATVIASDAQSGLTIKLRGSNAIVALESSWASCCAVAIAPSPSRSRSVLMY